jgi:hypothetical protein
MANFGELVVIYDILPELAVKIEEVLSKEVRKAAFDIAGHAMANIKTNGQVDTGFMMNSVYVEPGGSGANPYEYGRVGPENKGQELLPKVEKPSKPTEAIVAVGANYGIFQELGTVHQPARPYFTPAVEYVAPQFLRALELLEEKLAASVVIPGGGEG